MNEKKTSIAVIGCGISGLSAAYYIREKAREMGLSIELSLFESEARTGGKIISEHRHGFVCEGGPNGFLDNKPGMLALTKRLGLENETILANEQAAKRFILIDGKLQQVPESPPAFLRSQLLSPLGKIRIFKEVLSRRCPEGVDESIADFGRRHIGGEAVEKLLDPMVTGIFGGDVNKLSLKSCFPRMAELEAEYRSLLLGMLKLQKQKKKMDGGKASGSPAGPGGRLHSFRDGMETVIKRLELEIGENLIKKESPLTGIAAETNNGRPRYTLKFGDNGGGLFHADVVIPAIPAWRLRAAMKNFDDELASLAGDIPYAPMAVVCLGFPRAAIGSALDGFGFLVPHRENRRLLGSLWTSSIFNHRVPGGTIMMRNMVGGARDIKTPFLADDELVDLVVEELKPLIDIKGKPSFSRVFRWRNAIPQYVTGHGARLKKMEDTIRARYPGIFLAGNAYKGVSMNDCVENSEATAEQALSYAATAKT